MLRMTIVWQKRKAVLETKPSFLLGGGKNPPVTCGDGLLYTKRLFVDGFGMDDSSVFFIKKTAPFSQGSRCFYEVICSVCGWLLRGISCARTSCGRLLRSRFCSSALRVRR